MSVKHDSKVNVETAGLPSTERRKLIKMMLAAGPTLSLLAVNHQAIAQNTAEKVPTTDPVANALGYVEDATKVDAARYTTFGSFVLIPMAPFVLTPKTSLS